MIFALNYTTLWERFLEWYRGSWADRVFTFLGERVFVVAFGEYEKIPLPANAGTLARDLILTFLVAFWIAAVTMAFVKAVPGGFIRKMLALGAIDEEHAVTLAEVGYRKSAAVRRDLLQGGALAKLLCRAGNGEITVAGTPVPSPDEEVDPQTGESRPSLAERLAGAEKPTPSAPESAQTDAGSGEKEPDAPASEAPAEQAESKEPEPAQPALDFNADRFYIPETLRIRAEYRFARRDSGFLSALISVVASTAVAFLLCGLLPILFRFANFLLGGG